MKPLHLILSLVLCVACATASRLIDAQPLTSRISYPSTLYRGTGISMLPTLPLSCWIVVTSIPYEHVKVGMIATYRSTTGALVTHRCFYQMTNGWWVMKGDNNEHRDMYPMTPRNYVGVTFMP